MSSPAAARRNTPPSAPSPRATGAAPASPAPRASAKGPAKAKPAGFRCSECGWGATKWVGRCGECQAWGTLEEIGTTHPRDVAPARVVTPAQPIGEVSAVAAHAVSTGVGEFDRVLGGGIVPGAVVLLAGEPGVGKSTLLLEVAATFARAGQAVLYVTGEESAAQVRLRADRVGALADSLFLAAESDLATVLGHIEQQSPALCIVDSVQTIAAAEVEGSAGGVSQVRQVAASLIKAAKARNMATLLVGHVTKDGNIAGPRVLEHLVDVVCQFEGDRHSRLRLVRAVKNRYGPTDEVGCFDLSDSGIEGLPDPSGLFLSQSTVQVPGTCVTVTVEGRRPLVTEIQALVAPSTLSNPRRATSGLDSSRVAMLLAVAQRRVGVPLGTSDVYVATVGGARISEPAVDLPAALAVASAAADWPLKAELVTFGEVGLAGELRPVTALERRLSEAARLGFKYAIVPADKNGVPKAPVGLRMMTAASLAEAWTLAQARKPDA
ncbi:DNA repair protein RadA [Micrococcales bacterium 31B]|nr:DNA repair protein RadA [Micrococcales bacterium 31B]